MDDSGPARVFCCSLGSCPAGSQPLTDTSVSVWLYSGDGGCRRSAFGAVHAGTTRVWAGRDPGDDA